MGSRLDNPRKTRIKNNQVVHIWIIALIMDLCIVIFNSHYIDISGWFPWSYDVETAQGISLFVLTFIFTIPILYASIVFGLKGTILSWLVFLVAALPRTALTARGLEGWMPFSLYALVVLLLGLLISLARSATRKEKDLLQQSSPKRWQSVSRILKAQESERKRIARELHNDTIQDLLVIVNHLHALELGIHGDLPRETIDHVEGVEKEILHVIDNMRRMSHGLRTSVLDNLALVPALKWLAESMTSDTVIAVSVKVIGRERKIKEEAEALVFRIVQEALSNVKKHSGATQAEIVLNFTTRDFRLSVSDNGKGFVLPETEYEDNHTGELGLDIIRQRVKLLGGKLSIQSAPGKGTTISIETGMV